MIETEYQVSFTSVESIFSKTEIENILKYAKLKPHHCHENSFNVAQDLNCGVCEGVIFDSIPHAFNYIDNKGERVYFDFTAYCNQLGKPYYKPSETATVLRLYPNWAELWKKHVKKGRYHLTIEEDNRYREYLYSQTNVNV